MNWTVYILQCADDSLYTGITTDVVRRVREHNDPGSSLGAKFTRSRQPVSLIYHEAASSRSAATKREIEIKSLSRQQKLQIIKAAG